MKVAIIGGGAWGTALAAIAAQAGHEAALWARNKDVVAAINDGRGNPLYLPDIPLDPSIRASDNISKILDGAGAVLMVTPSQAMREVAQNMAPYLNDSTPVALCCKGVERGSGALMSEVAVQTLPQSKIAVLSGPTFASEVARGLPTAVTLATEDDNAAQILIEAIGVPTFRPYITNDVIGAEVGGAVKNVLAIACGIVTGKKLGENARAALITRGLSEVVRLSLALGGRADTVMGLSGLGDLALTCGSPQSRNMSLGIALGEGQSLDDILSARHSVSEGVWSAPSVVALAKSKGIEMPIAEAVNAVISDGADIDQTIHKLLSRPFRGEK